MNLIERYSRLDEKSRDMVDRNIAIMLYNYSHFTPSYLHDTLINKPPRYVNRMLDIIEQSIIETSKKIQSIPVSPTDDEAFVFINPSEFVEHWNSIENLPKIKRASDAIKRLITTLSFLEDDWKSFIENNARNFRRNFKSGYWTLYSFVQGV